MLLKKKYLQNCCLKIYVILLGVLNTNPQYFKIYIKLNTTHSCVNSDLIFTPSALILHIKLISTNANIMLKVTQMKYLIC